MQSRREIASRWGLPVPPIPCAEKGRSDRVLITPSRGSGMFVQKITRPCRRALFRAPYRLGSATRTSSTRFVIPSLRRTGSRTSGANQAEKRDVEKGWEFVELHGLWWACDVRMCALGPYHIVE
jgi:hypothetical protein